VLHKLIFGDLELLILHSHGLGLGGRGPCLFGRRLEQVVVAVQYEVVDLLLDALKRELVDLVTIASSCRLLDDGCLLRHLLLLWLEESALEGHEGIEEAALSCKSLLVLEHLLRVVARELSQSVHVDLDLVFVVFELAENG
jgi:hypothetical protein